MKKAILVVSFGTTDLVQLEKTIMGCIKYIEETFKDYDTYYGFSSQVVVNRLKERHQYEVPTIVQTMEKIVKAGYEKLLVQPLHLMAGKEYEKVQGLLRPYEKKLQIQIGQPLLTEEILDELVDYLKESEEGGDQYCLWIGHGTDHQAHEIYQKLDHKMNALRLPAKVMTLDQIEHCHEVGHFMKKHNRSKLVIRPLMLVAGNHLLQDIAGDQKHTWQYKLKQKRIDVEVVAQGLGEYQWVKEIFVRRIQIIDSPKVL